MLFSKEAVNTGLKIGYKCNLLINQTSWIVCCVVLLSW